MSKLEFGIMCDIETLDVQESAIVLQAAFVPYQVNDIWTPQTGFVAALPFQTQLDMGRTLTGDTLKWWLGPDAPTEVLMDSLSVAGSPELIVGQLAWIAQRLETWKNQWDITELYGKGAGFDVRTLKHLFRQYGVKWPFDYFIELDLRTTMRNAGVGKDDVPRSPLSIKHKALDDAQHQIVILGTCVDKIRG